MVRSSLDIVEGQLAKLMPQWEAAQQSVDLSRRIAQLWEERYEWVQDDASLDGAIWYVDHLNKLLAGSDPAITRKLSDLQLKQANAAFKKVEADIKAIEEWLTAVAGTGHEEESKYRGQLAELQHQLAELKFRPPHKFRPPQNPGLN